MVVVTMYELDLSAHQSHVITVVCAPKRVARTWYQRRVAILGGCLVAALVVVLIKTSLLL